MRLGFLPFCFIACFCFAWPGTCQVFVSTKGDDANAGSAKFPVKTLEQALTMTREASGNRTHEIRVEAGDYYDTGLTLSSKDSNLTLRSEGPTPARLIGGIMLADWKPDGARFWAAALPTGRKWDIRLLQVDGRFCPRARYPEQGTLNHETVFNVPWMSTTGGGWKRQPTAEELTTLRYKAGDIPEDIDIQNAEITVYHMWDESVSGIRQNDSKQHTFILNPPLGHPPGAFGVQKYCLWNTKEGMFHPGQWYFDRTRSRVVYWPLEGQDMAKVVAVVPTRVSIVQLVGATNVTLRNLSLEVTTVPLITGGFAAASFHGAVQLDAASGATLSQLHIRNVAGQGIKGMARQDSTRVVDCEITGCGAGGAYLSGPDNIISNCLIHGVGLMFPSAMGINGGGARCQLSHNEIYDTTYSAIGFGGKDVFIENNLISDCMKVLHDGAAIYCFGIKHSVLRNNFAHDIVDTGGYGASAYYLDEQSEDNIVEKNLSVNVARPSHNHMATNNVVRDNVFIAQGEMRLTFPRCAGYKLENNVLFTRGALVFEGINNVTSWHHNVVYSGTGKIEGKVLQDYSSVSTETGVRGDTVAADPQFRDLDKLDLSYRPQSPAARLGLTPLASSTAGRMRAAGR